MTAELFLFPPSGQNSKQGILVFDPETIDPDELATALEGTGIRPVKMKVPKAE